MKDILEILKPYLDRAANVLGKAVDSAMSEIPKIMNEYLLFRIFDYCADIAVSAFLIILSIVVFILAKRLFKKGQKLFSEGKQVQFYWDETNTGMLFIILSIILSVIFSIVAITSACGIFDSGKRILQIKYTPRAFLIWDATTKYKELQRKRQFNSSLKF